MKNDLIGDKRIAEINKIVEKSLIPIDRILRHDLNNKQERAVYLSALSTDILSNLLVNLGRKCDERALLFSNIVENILIQVKDE